MALKAILYDHDGTLVDSEIIHYQLWASVLADFSIEFSETVYRQDYSGLPTLDNARDAITRYGLDISPHELVARKSKASEIWLATQPFPLMAGALDSIVFFKRAGLKLAIVTGTDRPNLTASVTGHRLQQHFDTLVCANDVTRNKPAPDGYLLALEQLGVAADEAIAIEDTPHGAIAATEAGLDCIVVPNGMSPSVEFDMATHVCDSLEQATRWIAARYLPANP